MKVFYSAVIVILIAILSSCSSPDLTTPEGFAKEFLETLKNNDVEAFLKLTPRLPQLKKLSEKDFGSFDENKFSDKLIKPIRKWFKRIEDQGDIDWNSIEFVDAKYEIEKMEEMEKIDVIKTMKIIFKDNTQNYSIELNTVFKINHWLFLKPPNKIKSSRSNLKTAENTAATIASMINPYFSEHPNSESAITKLKGGPPKGMESYELVGGNSIMLPEGYSFKVTSDNVIVTHEDGSEGKCSWK